MKSVMYFAFLFVPLAFAADGFAADCGSKAQAQCSAASACQWDASSKACVEKEPAPLESTGSLDTGMGDDSTSGDVDSRSTEPDSGEY